MQSIASKRVSKELQKIKKEALPPGIFLVESDPPNLTRWFVDLQVMGNRIYEGQTFRLQITFGMQYPIEPPEVVFVNQPDRPVPLHPHIYSNGFICLDLLGKGWSPVQTVESLCLSVQSMLAGNTLAERPPGDLEFVRGNTARPKDIKWVYHDEKC